MSTDQHCCGDEPGTTVLDVESLSQGPAAVARDHGRVVFIPRAAPGDRVRARIVEERGSFARAELMHRCVPGPAYREPPCPWVAECGGCPWQHVTYPEQLAAKARNVREALARIGGVTARRELPILASPFEWGYRRRIRMHVGPDKVLGYREPRSQRTVAVGGCAIADPLLELILPDVRELVRRLATRLTTVELIANGRGGVVVLAAAEDFDERDAAALPRFVREVAAIAAIQLGGKGWERTAGDPTVEVVPDPVRPPLAQRPASFTQVNPAANQLLVAAVLAMAAPARRVLDLFCGAGNLSLPFAHAGFAVLGVDRDAAAIADAAASAAAAELREARFEAMAADRFLRQQGLAGAELVALDPPRAGAPKVADRLAELRPRRIVYVSCDPATLARDVRTLTRAGYAVDRVQPIDLFPQTEHVETVLEAVLA